MSRRYWQHTHSPCSSADRLYRQDKIHKLPRAADRADLNFDSEHATRVSGHRRSALDFSAYSGCRGCVATSLCLLLTATPGCVRCLLHRKTFIIRSRERI